MAWNSKEPRWHGEKRPKVNPGKFMICGEAFARVRYGQGEVQFPKV